MKPTTANESPPVTNAARTPDSAGADEERQQRLEAFQRDRHELAQNERQERTESEGEV